MTDKHKECRRKAVSAFFLEFTQWHRAFLRELALRYKERGRFPFIPIRELALSYEDKRDREIAAFAGMLIKDDAKAERKVRAFRVMFGESPSRWFGSRGFMVSGYNQDDRIGGVPGWRIAQLFDDIYEKDRKGWSWMRILNTLDVEECSRRLVRLIFAVSDGLGVGGWSVAPPLVKNPNSEALIAFLRLWMPEYGRRGRGTKLFSFDEAVKLFCFDREIDFFYSYLGWEALCRRKPLECSRYVTLYQKRYTEGNLLGEHYWLSARDGIVPKIEF